MLRFLYFPFCNKSLGAFPEELHKNENGDLTNLPRARYHSTIAKPMSKRSTFGAPGPREPPAVERRHRNQREWTCEGNPTRASPG